MQTLKFRFYCNRRKFVDKDDRIIVCQCHTRPATVRAFTGTKEWLDARF